MGKVRFDEIARECRETFKGSFTNIPIVGLEHIEPYDMKLQNYEVNVETTFTKQFHKGQILFGRRRAYQHKACVATFDGICSGDITVIEPIEGAVYPDLLPFIIQNDDFFEHAIKGSNGALSPRVKWEHMANFEFDLPSLAEQKVLAEKLWAAYEVKQSYLKMIAATEEMVKAQYVEMFACTDSIPLNSLVTLSKSSIMPKNGTTYTLYSFPAYDNNQTPEVIDGSEIKSSKISLEENVVLYNKLNVRLSRVWNIQTLNSPNNICSSEFLPLKVKDSSVISQPFLYRILNSDYVTKKMIDCSAGTSNSQKRISPSSLMNLSVPLPSLYDQRKFVTIAEQADKSISELRKSVDAIDKVIKSLINENL